MISSGLGPDVDKRSSSRFELNERRIDLDEDHRHGTVVSFLKASDFGLLNDVVPCNVMDHLFLGLEMVVTLMPSIPGRIVASHSSSTPAIRPPFFHLSRYSILIESDRII